MIIIIELSNMSGKFDFNSLVWPLAVWTIAWNLYPQPPRIIRELGRNEIFQYFLVFVLIWAVAGRSIPLAATTTLIIFVATRLLDGNFGLCNYPPPMQPQPLVI